LPPHARAAVVRLQEAVHAHAVAFAQAAGQRAHANHALDQVCALAEGAVRRPDVCASVCVCLDA
jgi:hypothetical protein